MPDSHCLTAEFHRSLTVCFRDRRGSEVGPDCVKTRGLPKPKDCLDGSIGFLRGGSMKRFVEGEDRTQVTLLPECLDDYIEAENPVRVIEVFVDELDLGELGFAGVEPLATGRPSYHPAVLLKIYTAHAETRW